VIEYLGEANASLDRLLEDPRLEDTRSLRLSRWGLANDPSRLLAALLTRSWPALRQLVIDSGGSLDESIETSLGDLSELWSCAPSLESLMLVGSASRLGTPRMASLSSFQLWLHDIDAGCARDLAGCALPALLALDLNVFSGSWPSLGIWTRAHFPALRTLKLLGGEGTVPLADLLAGDLLEQLEELELGFPNLSARDTEILSSNAVRFANLTQLVLDMNRVTPSAYQKLRAHLPMLSPYPQLPERMAEHIAPRSHIGLESVDALELSESSRRGLRRAGIATIGQLARASPTALVEDFGMELRSIRELRELLVAVPGDESE
jgi:hypothetical protein